MGCIDEGETKRVMGKEGRVNNSGFRGPYAGDECTMGNNFGVEKGATREKERKEDFPYPYTHQCGEGNEDDNLDLALED